LVRPKPVSLARFAALSLAAVGLYSFTPPFWSLPTAFLRGDDAAVGIAFINGRQPGRIPRSLDHGLDEGRDRRTTWSGCDYSLRPH
jgi:hypothetical protein